MAFQTGTATNHDDLLNILRVFAVAQGWTQNGWSVVGAGHRLHLQKSGQYVNLLSGTTSGEGYVSGSGVDDWPSISICGSTGYAGGSDWDAQPGTSGVGVSNDMGASNFTYWLFGGTDHVYCVAEVAAGIFKHIVFGATVKVCTFTGGAFVGAVMWNNSTYPSYIDNESAAYHGWLFDPATTNSYTTTFLRAEADSNVWWSFFGGAGTAQATSPVREEYSTNDKLMDWLYKRSPNDLNGQTLLDPIYMMIERAGGNWSLLGYPPDMRLVRMTDLTPGEEITIGSDTWVVFPVIQKNGAASTPDSADYGYAYKKVT